MARQGKKRRAHSPHRGVKLLRRDRADGEVWLGRWTDPDTGKPREVSLTKLGYTTHEVRRDWAVRKSKALAKRRAELEAGGSVVVDKTLADASADYFKAGKLRLRERTLELYQEAVDTFVGWSEGNRVRLTKDVMPATLAAFREDLSTKPRRIVAKGGRRGERAAAVGRVPKATTTNKRLRAVATFLTHLRRLGLTPRLTSDDIADGLRPLRQPKPRPTCLRPAELQALLRAALRHDADTFDLTREEKARGLTKGETPRHPPIAPFLATVLLTGMRAGEALALRTDALYLDAVAGTAGAGEIILRPSDTKTAHARAVDLVVSPALRQILTALKLRAGDSPYLFGGDEPLSRDVIEAARRRLTGVRKRKAKEGEPEAEGYGAPPFAWQHLRQTCGSYLTNAPGIFGAASAFKSARQLGHSVAVAERHYLGVVHVPPEARSLDAAMAIADLLDLIVRHASGEANVGADVGVGVGVG